MCVASLQGSLKFFLDHLAETVRLFRHLYGLTVDEPPT